MVSRDPLTGPIPTRHPFRTAAARAGWIVALLLLAPALGAEGAAERSRQATVPGTTLHVVAAEGPLEPRSIGSYCLRVYGGRNTAMPFDDFIAGAIRSRDGTVEGILFPDLDGDGVAEVVVTMRSVGTGGYLAAEAFTFDGSALTLVGSVAGLAKDADAVQALLAASRLR